MDAVRGWFRSDGADDLVVRPFGIRGVGHGAHSDQHRRGRSGRTRGHTVWQAVLQRPCPVFFSALHQNARRQRLCAVDRHCGHPDACRILDHPAIGGGIAGDFPICVVPMLSQDLELNNTPFWSYFCQISDSTTSYGSYSGAVPNEKISWGKIDVNTPKFIIESDATIVAPLIFAYLLGW